MRGLKIAFILSDFQKNIVSAICAESQISNDYFDIIFYDGIDEFSSQYAKKTCKLPFLRESAFKKISSVRYAFFVLNSEIGNNKINEIWFPNDSMHLINMTLNKYCSKSTKLVHFEDGLRFYIDSGWMDFRDGFKYFFKSLISHLLFFPFYSKLQRFEKRAHEAWGLVNRYHGDGKFNLISASAFSDILEKEVVSIPKFKSPQSETTLMIFGQYYREAGYPLSFEEELFLDYSNYFKNTCFDQVYYKPHPREVPRFVSERVDSIKVKFNCEVVILPSKINAELVLFDVEPHFKKLVCISAFSTALYVGKILFPQHSFYYAPVHSSRHINNQMVSFFESLGVKKIEPSQLK